MESIRVIEWLLRICIDIFWCVAGELAFADPATAVGLKAATTALAENTIRTDGATCVVAAAVVAVAEVAPEPYSVSLEERYHSVGYWCQLHYQKLSAAS